MLPLLRLGFALEPEVAKVADRECAHHGFPQSGGSIPVSLLAHLIDYGCIQGIPCGLEILQVPVHPICLGRLVAARASAAQMTAYFRSVIDLQVARQEPCLLYDHPERIAQFSDVLADVLLYGKERCGSVTTMTEFTRWWQRRERFDWMVRAPDAGIEIQTGTTAGELSVIVEQQDRYSTLPAGPGSYSLAALKWRPMPAPVRFDPRSLAARKPSLRQNAGSFLRRMRKTLQGHRG